METLFDLHLELQHAARKVDWQVLLLQMVYVQCLFLLHFLLLFEFKVESLEVNCSFGCPADFLQFEIGTFDLVEIIKQLV